MTSTTAGPAVTARLLTTAPLTSPAAGRRRARVGRIVSGLLMGLLVFVIATLGAAGTPGTAAAIPFDGFFCNETGPIAQATSGPTALLPEIDPTTGQMADNDATVAWSGKAATAYEVYGTAGLVWSTWDDGENSDCWGVENWAGTFIANLIFGITTLIVSLAIGMYQWAASPNLLADFMTPMDCILQGTSGGATCSGNGLISSLYLEFLTPMIMLGALWVGWQGLVKKRTTMATQGVVWMLCSAVFSLVFLAHPSLIARTANDLVATVSGAVVNGATTAASTSGDQDICYLSDDAPNRGTRMAACGIYRALLVTPWATGQFGSGHNIDTTLPNKTVTIGTQSPNSDLRVIQIDAQTLTRADEANLSLDLLAGKQATWHAIQASSVGQAWATAWSGGNPGQRISIAFASLIAGFSAGALIIVLSFSIVVMALAMVLLILIAPLFLLIGVHPGFGRGIALKWLELLIGTAIKRIGLVSLLAVIVALYQVILSTSMAWFLQVSMIIAVCVAAVIFRKPFLETLNVVSLGGTQTGMEQGMDASAKKGLTGTMGAISGGAAGRAQGPMGVLRGALSGGASGSRSGSLLRAGQVGGGAGRRVSARMAAKDRDKSSASTAANDPFAYDKEQRQAAREESRLQEMVDTYADDPEMQRRLESWSKKTGKPLPPPRPAPTEGSGSTAPASAATGAGSAAAAAAAAAAGAATAGGAGGDAGGMPGGAGGTGGGEVPRPAADTEVADAVTDLQRTTDALVDGVAATERAQRDTQAAVDRVQDDVVAVKNPTALAQQMLRKIAAERDAAGPSAPPPSRQPPRTQK